MTNGVYGLEKGHLKWEAAKLQCLKCPSVDEVSRTRGQTRRRRAGLVAYLVVKVI